MADDATPSVEDVQSYIDTNFGSAEAPEVTPDATPDPATDPATQQTPDPVPAPPAAEDDGLPNPDLSDLDPAQRAYAEQRLVEMRRRITEATTEAAEYRKVAESVGGLENLQGLVSEIQALQADPRGSVAQNLYNTLKTQFEAQGASPEAAAAAAEQRVDDLSEGDYSDLDLPPEILAKLGTIDSLGERLNRFEATQAQEAEARARAQYEQDSAADMMEQWGKLEGAYPDLKGNEKAMGRIAALAHSTNGNLLQAHDMYREIVNEAQAELYNAAGSVPGGVTAPPAGAAHSQQPVEYDDIEDPNLREAAIEMIERLSAQ